ncbi:Chalcone isomerase [Cynara cardunculus var. scolymus]|uniref:Chalcone-flavonone isomerase family protein n=1 Tax=Cynara cardunculus var. scolymus TaxID=59895 RepID=A0A103YK60_CYNCS|nr:Chalcone isomerase [Cynara cardunculus var. scolymus]
MVGGGGIGIGATPRSVSLLPHNRFRPPNSNPIPRNRTHFLERNRIPPTKLSVHKFSPIRIPSFSIKATASSVGNTEYVEEPATNVKFQSSLSLPGCPSSLSLIGTEKSLQIVLVRDVDGKTFWDALDEAISPRIKSPQVDETALSTFRGIFQNRPLKKGTSIFLTWLHPSKMLVHLSAEGIPSAADATIQSENVTISLFDVFFGRGPVSPSLKASVSNCLASILR